MGFLGLIMTFFGAGVTIKDSIQENYYNSKNAEKAKSEGRSTFNGVYGGEYSLKTGNRVTTDYGKYRDIKYDTKTGEVVEDITTRINNKRELEAKNNAVKNGCVFYHTYAWNNNSHSCDIYICDMMPGRYFQMRRPSGNTYDCKTKYFIEGILVDDEWHGNGVKKLIVDCNNAKMYYEDGTERTKEEIERRSEAVFKERAISNGQKFYMTNHIGIYKNVDTDEYYMRCSIKELNRSRKEYYIKAVKNGNKFEVVEGSMRYNLNGTEFRG